MARKRKYRIIHEDFLGEYLALNFPPGSFRTNVPLGKVEEPERGGVSVEEKRMLRSAMGGRADAVVVHNHRVIIIECIIRHEPGSLEDLMKYKKLLRETPRYQKYSNYPIELWILTPLDMPWYEEFAEDLGIKVEKYKPAWVFEYLQSYPRRFQRGKLSSLEY